PFLTVRGLDLVRCQDGKERMVRHVAFSERPDTKPPLKHIKVGFTKEQVISFHVLNRIPLVPVNQLDTCRVVRVTPEALNDVSSTTAPIASRDAAAESQEFDVIRSHN